MVPVKDQLTLLRVAKHLQDSGTSFSLDIAGDGPLAESLRTTRAKLGLSSIVRFLGPVPHDQLAAHYRAASAVVLSSRHEAQCLAALEAAACGLPVIGTRVGTLPELAPPNRTVVGIADDRALADALARLLADESARTQASESALATIDAHFRLDCCTAAFRALYRDLASST